VGGGRSYSTNKNIWVAGEQELMKSGKADEEQERR